ncbi:hypothetical protein PPYR_13827 [Photinus pyralis]|uniref:Uncharacterized protein n=2 Tax=Photinus pyralis TaxID=7054 RepID=A0A5N4AA69_PHOPY|nr:hypothetical protein PPYR_13827 [Photinus pyralis]
MNEEGEGKGPRKETIEGKLNDGYTIRVLTLTSVVLIVLCSIFCARSSPERDVLSPSIDEQRIAPPQRRKLRVMTSQPNCTMEEYVLDTLREISSELYLRAVSCTPGDVNDLLKHTVLHAKRPAEETRGNSVIYIAVGLLLTSLVVAFLDVYKVKGKPLKSKPQLTKRCSLADLTVLRHSRRESMKKDSMVDDHRVPLKLLGARPPPDNRRCSVPIQAGDVSYGNISPRRGSRKCSLDDVCPDYSYTRVRLMRRF